MNPVVVRNIAANEHPQISRRRIFVRIDLLRLEAAEPALDHDVVRPAALSVHALADAELPQESLVRVACELASLIRVQYGGNAMLFHGIPDRLQDEGHIQRVREMMGDDLPTVPVDDGCKVHVPVRHRQVCDVDRPYLVRESSLVIAKQIRMTASLKFRLERFAFG